MDAMSEPGVQRVALMTSAQVGKTEMLNNLVGFHIHQDPSPILVLQPTLDMAETWSKDRLAPMVRDTPALRGAIQDARSRDSGNTILHKNFPGGHLTIVGANSPSSLASRPIRIVLADEVDRYPPSAGTEGDPLTLAIKRTTTFWNRRVMCVSTPTIHKHSRIELEYDMSDRRRYSVPCRECGAMQFMEWESVKFPPTNPEAAIYECPHCQYGWREADRLWSVARGEWRATNPEGKYPGFHLNELYSPWSTVVDVARSWVQAQRSVQLKKTWHNTVLGLPYEEDAERIDFHALAERKEDFPEEGAPLGVLVVTCGVDVQGNRLEIERVGWGVDEENWSLDHHVLHGDPSDPELWRRLDAYLMKPTIREDGRELPIRTTCIDSGGHHTQAVYKFARLRRHRRIFAIKGREDQKQVWPPAMTRTRTSGNKNVSLVGTTAAKDVIYSHLRVEEPGPGYCHFPRDRTDVWFEQLTAEQIVTKYFRGFPKRVYVLPEGRLNEALDCRVYAYAALQSMGIRWGTEISSQVTIPKTPSQSSKVPAPQVAAQAMEKQKRAGAPSNRAGGFLRRGGSSWLGRR
jgi:phage terminase large subunit GpA-like protein